MHGLRERWRKMNPLYSGVLLKMEVGIRKGVWRRAWRYPAYLWSLRWVYSVKKPGGWYTAYTRVYSPIHHCPYIGWHTSSWTISDAKINVFLSSQNYKFSVAGKRVLLNFGLQNFEWYLIYLFYYSWFSDVTITITALLHHSAYGLVDGKVIKMERLNESQLRAQAVRMFEANYSYSVIAKKLSHNKGWVSNWTRHRNTNLAESLQSQSRRWLTSTRSSAIAEGPRNASCQLKSCQLPCNSAETSYTTSPDQIDGMKLEI